MIISYGGYSHQAKESNFKVSSRMETTPDGREYAIRTSIQQEGTIFGDTQAELSANISALLSAYSKSGGNYVVRFNNGSPTPDINISNSNTFGGVRIVSPPSFNPKHQAEYSTYWSYRIEIEALVLLEVSKQQKFIWEFEESLEFQGDGGPVLEWVDLKFGRAQSQITYPFSQCHMTQKGHLTFLNSRPTNFDIPQPMYPNLRDSRRSRIGKPAPRRIFGQNVEWRLDYEFFFTNNAQFPNPEPHFLK